MIDVCDIQVMKPLLAEHGFHFSKAKGQNFLIAPWVPESIVREAGVDKAAGVLEIGPGIGTMTQYLAESARERMKQMRTSHFAYKDKLRAEHEAFKKEVMAKWGDKSMVESTKKEWVEYSDDKESRTKVDFESGTVTVEVISDKGEPQSATKARLEESVSNLLESKGKTIDFKSEVVEQKPVTEKPAETRMGSGKGSPEYWVAVVKPGRVLFEIDGVSEEVAREALRLAMHKLPIKCKFIAKPKTTEEE